MSIRPFLPTGGKITPMQLLIYIQLLEGPKYGYEILKNLREDFEGSWTPKTGTVYPALKSLVRKELVKEESIDETTYYSVTPKGVDFVKDTREFVKEYVLFNYQFMTVAVERLPIEFTMSLLMNFLELGFNDLIPEQAIIEAIRSITDIELRKSLLSQRKQALVAKTKSIDDELKLIGDLKKERR